MTDAPQKCPSPECGRSLADPSVPIKFLRYRKLFTLAYEKDDLYGCPFCGHTWPIVNPRPRKARQE